MAVEEKWYFTKEQLENSPSRKCDIDCDKELSYRQQAANFIQDMGQRLQVTQLCINTAIVYMHRFYVFHSFTHFHRYSMAAAALFLAAKVEEQPRKLEHVIKVAHLCLHREAGGPPPPPPPDVKSEQYAELAHDLVFNENVLLQTLGFDVAIDHPHTHVVRCCHLVKASKDLAQTSYFLASNSLHLTTMCLKYKPTVVACFCIHLACKWSNWEIPNSSEGKQWFLYVDSSVTSKLLEELTEEFIQIYNKCPSRLKKKIMSMSANQQCPSGHNPPTNNSNPMTNSVSPLTSEPRKIQTPPVSRDGVPHHSKVHYGEQKPSVPSQHRPPHESQNLNYLERKERERMEQKQLISQHHKPSLSVKQVQPSTSSKQHHRSNSGGIDPKLKVPQHSNPSVSRPLSSTSRADPHQMHQRTGEQQYSGTKDINQHRDLNRNSSDLGREPGRDPGREYCRDPAREINRGNQGNRDVTASREHFFGRDPGTKEQFNNGERDSKRERVSVSSDNLLQDKNRDSYVSGNSSSSSNRVDQSNHNVNRESAYRAYQIGREINKSRLDIANNDSLINDINRDNNERLRFEQARGTKSSLASNDISKLSGNNLQSNESKYDDANRGGRELSESYSTAPKLYPKQLPYADVAKNKTQNVDKLYVGKSNSFRTINMEGHEDGNVGLTSSYRQQKPKLPQSSGGSNLPVIENKTSLVSIQSGPQYSSQSSLNKNDRSRNGSKTSLEEESYVRKKDVESSESNHSTTRPFLQTPPPKQKSIFSPVKEISPPKANSLQLSKRSKNKTSPSNNSKRLIETPRLPSGLGVVPSPISPFGSPPAPAVTPNKNFNSKNRNRTSSSSSEPELVPVLKKLEEMSGFENIITDSKIKLRVPDIVQLIKDVKPLESESPSPNSCTSKTSSIREQKPAESVKPSLQIKTDLTHKIDPPVSPSSRHCLTSNESTVNGVETKQILINDVSKGTVSTNHISATVDPTLDQFVVPLIDDSTLLRDTASLQNVAPNLEENKLEHHHKSEKKKKKDKHKHKDKDRTREDKEKKKKHKDKDRDKHKEKLTLFEFESIVAPLKITIPKDKITPISTENPTGLKIKIPKERLKTTANTSPSGGLKIKISKDKIETLSATSENNRKRERDDQTARTGPPTKTAKVSYSRPSEADRQNGRNSYNSKQVLLGEGAQVGAMAQQWSKLAESKYHSKTAGATSGNRPPTS